MAEKNSSKNDCIQGYDYEFIAIVPDEYICKICHLVLRKPVQTKCCGHRFCKECLQEFNKIKEQPQCPMDRQTIDQQDVFEDKGAERTISSLHVICPSDGCNWQGALGDLESHLKMTCPFKIIKCKNKKCAAMMLRMERSNHLERECEWRKVPCSLCNQNTAFCELEAHEEKCDYKIVKCTNRDCAVMMPRIKMTNHLEQECEWREVSCPHCKQTTKFHELEAHEQACEHKVIKCSIEQCDVMKPRKEMTNHLEQECEWREVPCPRCKQTTKFRELEAHEKTCDYVTVKCSIEQCDVMMPRIEMTNHLEQECEWREVPCPHCYNGHHVFKLQDHIKVCPKAPVKCPNKCGIETTNEEIADHMANECPLTEFPCIYQCFGCQFLIQRRQESKMEEHMGKAVKDHLALACEGLKSLQEKNDTLTDQVLLLQEENETMSHQLLLIQDKNMSKFDQLCSRLSSLEDQNMFQSARLNVVQEENESMFCQLSSLNDKHEVLSNQVALLQGENKKAKKEPAKKEEQAITCTNNFVWKIEGVKIILQQAKEGRVIALYSEPFYTANRGYKLRIMLFPNGDRKENKGHMSLYAQILKGKYDGMLPWPFSMDLTFTLIDQKVKIQNRKNVKDIVHSKNSLDRFPQCFQKPTTDYNTGMPGRSRFVTHEKLMSKSYVKDNSLIIMVDVSKANK